MLAFVPRSGIKDKVDFTGARLVSIDGKITRAITLEPSGCSVRVQKRQFLTKRPYLEYVGVTDIVNSLSPRKKKQKIVASVDEDELSEVTASSGDDSDDQPDDDSDDQPDDSLYHGCLALIHEFDVSGTDIQKVYQAHNAEGSPLNMLTKEESQKLIEVFKFDPEITKFLVAMCWHPWELETRGKPEVVKFSVSIFGQNESVVVPPKQLHNQIRDDNHRDLMKEETAGRFCLKSDDLWVWISLLTETMNKLRGAKKHIQLRITTAERFVLSRLIATARNIDDEQLQVKRKRRKLLERCAPKTERDEFDRYMGELEFVEQSVCDSTNEKESIILEILQCLSQASKWTKNSPEYHRCRSKYPLLETRLNAKKRWDNPPGWFKVAADPNEEFAEKIGKKYLQKVQINRMTERDALSLLSLTFQEEPTALSVKQTEEILRDLHPYRDHIPVLINALVAMCKDPWSVNGDLAPFAQCRLEGFIPGIGPPSGENAAKIVEKNHRALLTENYDVLSPLDPEGDGFLHR